MASAEHTNVRRRVRLSIAAAVATLTVAMAGAVPRADGPYLAARPEAFEGRVVGAGHCVDFVKTAARAPRTAAWRRGAVVRGNPHIARGTAIATFEADGTYTNESGNHSAIYLYQDERGIWVYDQWRGQPVHKRLIRFQSGRGSGAGSKSNDGKRFAVIA
jgi:hypothetical protein